MKFEIDKYDIINCGDEAADESAAFNTWSEYFTPNRFRIDSGGYNDMTRSSLINGTLACFCDQQYATKGRAAMFQKYKAAPETKGVSQGKIC